jgi:hypothetical protein
MANVYAVKSGNWSDVTVWNTGALPTSADDVFSNNFTVAIDTNVTVNSIQNTAATGVASGGSFQVTSSKTITCTKTIEGIVNVANVVCLNVNTSGDVIVNSDVRGRDGTSVRCITKSGTGTLAINGNLRGNFSSGSGGGALQITNTGTVTITGTVFEGPSNGSTILVSSACTLNVVGNVISGNFNVNLTLDVAAANSQLNITGNLIVGSQAISGWSSTVVSISGSNVIFNLVGDIDATQGISNTKIGLLVSGLNCEVTHTGNIVGTSNDVIGGIAFTTTAAIKYNQVGYIKASMGSAGFISTNGGAINILTGPFISSPSGIQPLYVTRMHYRRTMGSYYEFRDSSTNGALPPAAPAPAARLVSPDTLADPPIPANVRQGVVYAFSSQTGTMVVPNPINVSAGVPVDNTVGTAALNPSDIWDASIDSLNTLNSIGRRLKNAATVETTGAQLENLIGNNE